jgi:fucose permease
LSPHTVFPASSNTVQHMNFCSGRPVALGGYTRNVPEEHVPSQMGLTPIVIAATFTGLALIGLMASSVGPSLDSIRARYSVTDAVVGLWGSAQFAGAILGNLTPGLLPRLPMAVRMAGGMALFGVCCLLLALSSIWAVALGIVFVAGLGFGTFQVNYAAIFSRGFGARSGTVMAVMSVSFGLGSILGPAIIGLISSERYTVLLAGCGVAALLVSLPLMHVRFNPETHSVGSRPQASTPLGILAGFGLLSVLYVAAEQSVGFWGPTHLTDGLGFKPSDAAFMTSAFWMAITVGRALVVPITLRVSSQVIVLGALALSSACLLIAPFGALASMGYVLAGIFFGPVFPSGLVWVGQVSTDLRSTSVFLVAGTVGALVCVPFMGVLKEWLGTGVIPVSILGFALFALAVVFWLRGTLEQQPV